MALKFYMDVHVQSAISKGLQRLNIDVLTVQEDGKRRASDAELLNRATELGRIMFTRDEDFLAEAHHRQEEAIPFIGVVYAHQMGISIGECIHCSARHHSKTIYGLSLI